MSLLETVLWVLAFAAATMLIYGWGLVKIRNQQRDLLSVLYGKGEALVKKHGSMSRAELEKALSGIRASLFYSHRQQAVVNDPKVFTSGLLRMMTEKNMVTGDGHFYRLK